MASAVKRVGMKSLRTTRHERMTCDVHSGVGGCKPAFRLIDPISST
jgi:hypothetical protein